ncbi:MAG: AAA family ATPase [Lachnospiraceae bacterium]|nr:AAA family ATPase [Lachnospiraceae bacterium]MBR4060588.1 AAA family ATPase [Lachnospiraceae bacterium]
MDREVAIGIQNFNELIEKNCFYVDKTHFIKEWWDSGDSVTLITRPRRFGKTLTMSMVEQFFSVEYAGRSDLFAGLSIWKEDKYRELQGTYPVISLSFANVKEKTYEGTKERICQLLAELYAKNNFLLESDLLTDADKQFFKDIKMDMPEVVATFSLHKLAGFLSKYYGKKVIILLDEYDTPMQEAYVDGYWEELVAFSRSLFNATFKTNPFLERAIMTGITRVSKESIFSDLNHLEVVTATVNKYTDCFGFTEEEVFAGLDEFGYTDKAMVKEWYDGFIFGKTKGIYNPWSILNYLDKGEFKTYWANTSSNSLISKLIRESDKSVKTAMEDLLHGKILKTQLDEQIVFSQLNTRTSSIWSFLLASGYLKAVKYFFDPEEGRAEYELALTNKEVRFMFEYMIEGWFSDFSFAYNEFIKALLQDDLDAMNEYMNKVALQTFSFFDVGAHSSEYSEPERFYHGFVLGLMVDLKRRYVITSNRESGFGRYDIILEPLSEKDVAIIIEFKVRKKRENSLEETLQNAWKQIEEKQYEAALIARGIPAERIRKYGFAFEGKNVLIG